MSTAERLMALGMPHSLAAHLNSGNYLLDYMSTDGTLASNADTKVPTQKAVKTYADAVTTATAALDAANVKLTGNQSIAGVKTFANMFKIPIGADVPAAGSVIGDAAALATGFQTVSAANGTKGVILPVTTGGDIVIIKGTANAVLKVWPQTGAQINAVGASTAMSLASGLIPAIFISVSATQWYSIPLLPS